jgi:hypothetical protein
MGNERNEAQHKNHSDRNSPFHIPHSPFVLFLFDMNF